MKKLFVLLLLGSIGFCLTGCDLSTNVFKSSSEDSEKENITSTSSLSKKTTKTLEKKISSYNLEENDEENDENIEDMEAVDYNNAIIDLLDECMGWEAEFYDILESDDDFPDDFIEIFENTLYACQTAQEELQNYSSFEGDSSLADAVNEFLEVENTMLDLYNEYFSLEEDLDEESEEEFWETIDDLDTASSTLFEQLATVQEQFAEKYDFSLEDEEE